MLYCKHIALNIQHCLNVENLTPNLELYVKSLSFRKADDVEDELMITIDVKMLTFLIFSKSRINLEILTEKCKVTQFLQNALSAVWNHSYLL